MTDGEDGRDPGERRLVQGNEACAHGALYAGCDFYAGYPITPASEIMEVLSRELPARGGSFLQMEDEIGAISAVVGGAWGGARAMTATSGPGFSLMQEGLGFAAMTETPCVIVDAQRWGPSTGQPTKPSQGDLMQAIWGTHGDHPVVVTTASSVQGVFEGTVEAFNLARRLRVPVVFLIDEVLAHMREDMVWPAPGDIDVFEPEPASEEQPVPFGGDAFVPLGEGQRFTVTGLAHDEWGRLVEGEEAGAMLQRMTDKIRERTEQVARYESRGLAGARAVVVSYGTVSRAADHAVEALRKEGMRVGTLDLKTLWPFPDFLFGRLPETVEYLVVPELNRGQLIREVERAAYTIMDGNPRIEQLERIDGRLIEPEQIVRRVRARLETLVTE